MMRVINTMLQSNTFYSIANMYPYVAEFALLINKVCWGWINAMSHICMTVMLFQITCDSTVGSIAITIQQQTKHQNSALLALVWENISMTTGFLSQRAGNIWITLPYHAIIMTYVQHLRNRQDHFYQHGLSLISVFTSNRGPNKVWDEIAYPFPNFNGSFGMDK